MNELLLWQLADSAFPSGGFTHSSGLEAAAQFGHVRTADDLWRAAVAAVRQAGHGGLPFVRAAHRRPEDLPALDARVDLFLNQPVGNRASRAQGQALLNSAIRIFPDAGLETIAAVVSEQGLCAHHAPLFGIVMLRVGVDTDEASELFLYQAGRSVLGAAVRLGLVGVFESQRQQAELTHQISATLSACRDIAADDAAQTTPIVDLLQSTQDRLYSRLFQS